MKRQLVEREWTEAGPGPAAPAPGRRGVTVNLAESPLVWLHARGHLTDVELAAGECLRRDYEAAQLAPSVTMRWDPVRVAPARSAGALTSGERQLAARERFHGAVTAAGTGLADVLWRVVCAGDSLAEAERTLGWPSRSGKLVLRFALDRVAKFYRLG